MVSLVAIHFALRKASASTGVEAYVVAAPLAIGLLYGLYAGIKRDAYPLIFIVSFAVSFLSVASWCCERMWTTELVQQLARSNRIAFYDVDSLSTNIIRTFAFTALGGCFGGVVGATLKQHLGKEKTQLARAGEQREKEHEVAEI